MVLLTAKRTTSRPNTVQGRSKAITTIGSHSGLDNLEWLAQGGDLEHVQPGTKQQVGELDGLFLQLVTGDGT